jgi:hypothetical protein
MAVETHYTKSGATFIAYQVSGQPTPDLMVVPGFFSHLEHDWEDPRFARFNHALGSFSRLICFVLVQGQMCSEPVVVGSVGGKDSTEMVFAKDDDVV